MSAPIRVYHGAHAAAGPLLYVRRTPTVALSESVVIAAPGQPPRRGQVIDAGRDVAVIQVLEETVGLPPARATVTHLAVGEDLHRASLPLAVYPYSAGVKGGIAGGAAMALLAVVHGIVGTVGDAQSIGASLGKSDPCFQDVKITRTSQMVGGERQKYVMELDVKCPIDQKGPAKKPGASPSASASAGGK